MNSTARVNSNEEAISDSFMLRAGALTIQYEAGEIRYVRLGKHEILRRVFAAVRDHNWNPIPARITLSDHSKQADNFEVRLADDHDQENIHFAWRGTIRSGAVSSRHARCRRSQPQHLMAGGGSVSATNCHVENAHQFSEGRALMVSPVMFKMRFNPAATRLDPEPEPGTLPRQYDPRPKHCSEQAGLWAVSSTYVMVVRKVSPTTRRRARSASSDPLTVDDFALCRKGGYVSSSRISAVNRRSSLKRLMRRRRFARAWAKR